jgi:hypothetical protein
VPFLQAARAADEHPGAAIYRSLCARCHGAHGEGVTNEYPDPLVGDKSLKELSAYIAESMPESAPEECVGEDAAQVAAYIYDAFYSKLAQARIRPPQLELSRLTVRQYQNAVADLIGSFRGQPSWDEKRGLSAEYYNSRRFDRDERVSERVDPQVSFDFDGDSPDPETIKPEEFSIRWEGSVIAPDTGDYEFIIETENGARLWVNDDSRELIDAWVRSGDQTEHRGSVRLLGGRAYPLVLEFFKFKEPTALIRLKWKPPRQAEELIPERLLLPREVPQTLVVTTPFPPDDRSTGFERGNFISREWEQAITQAALEVADQVTKDVGSLSGTRGKDDDRSRKLRTFAETFASRAFRRPLEEDWRRTEIEVVFDNAPKPDSAIRRVVLRTLLSPRFLYREAGVGPFDAYDTASWLSFALWDSLPDARLLQAAAEDRLSTRSEIAAQAERMLQDPRTRAKVREFLHQWLKVDHFDDISKDSELYPQFDEAFVSDLRTSLDLFLDEAVWGPNSDFRDLLQSDALYVNGRLADFYGVDLPPEAPFQKVWLEEQDRAGVLSHPYLMAGFAYDRASSPIHRGVFIARNLLGRLLKPPPIAVAPLTPELHAGLTTRERVVVQTSPSACQTCHAMINPLGFTLENFDAVGRFRTEEQGRPIDAQGIYLSRTGEAVQLSGVRELAEFLADSRETREAFAEQMFLYLIKQPPLAFGLEEVHRLTDRFVEDELSVRRLIVEIVASSAIHARDVHLAESRSPTQTAP